jgi:hypothetical protein
MKHPTLLAVCVVLACSACASVSLSGAPVAAAPEQTVAHEQAPLANLQGRWVGTFFQDNERRSYPMELTADGDANGFAVTLDWPELWQSRTVGHGSIHADSATWTEDRLVRGQNILLDGHYEAALIDHDTLVGVYEKDGRRMGFFTLSRARGGPKVTEIPPIRVKVAVSG